MNESGTKREQIVNREQRGYKLDENDEFITLIRRIGAWVTYCGAMRENGMEPDRALDLSNDDYYRWDELARKYWNER